MSSPPNLRPIQDMPPPGGYPALDVSKKLGKQKFGNAAIIGIVSSMVILGYWKVGKDNQWRRQLKQEKRERRAFIVPFLQAESDIQYTKHNL
eukprot:snap_masked-scaffold_44-processed-gene-1.26-mRNA-1 protein AED:1.00 eAED:1.00 QI:0/-1/0/0/-1/1/1/0/91